MAESVVLTVALEKVRDLLIEESKFLYGVRGEVEEIEKELKRMRKFLESADAKQDEDDMLRHRVAEIREISEEVDLVLETFAIEVASRRSGRGIKTSLKRYACIFKECVALHSVGSEIASIKTKITNLNNSLPKFDIRQGESSSSALERQRWQRLSYPHFEEDFVGMEEDIRQLVCQLVNEEKRQRPRVVSICGMGGLGKTSLAKKVYNDNEVRRCFNRFAWVCITQQWQLRDVLKEILIGLVPENRKQIANQTDRELVEQLYRVQQDERCLIVIDDIWSNDAWDCLKSAFPRGETVRSIVLLTTRDKQVALHADPTGFVHEPHFLDEKESWDLFQKKAFRRSDNGTVFKIDPGMEKLGKEMVRRCGGLPLALVVLGGNLVMKHTYTSREWETVLQNIKSYLARGEGISKKDGGVSDVLALSYKNLPYHLKACFLYLGHCPEDSEIKAEKLYHMWVVERLVSSEDRLEGETMMNVAERYLEELAQRYMVQVRVKEPSATRSRYKSCRLHDLMRDLCLLKVKEENFIKFVICSQGGFFRYSNGHNQPKPQEEEQHSSSFSAFTTTKTRRLAIYNSSGYENGGDSRFSLFIEKDRARHVRSILFVTGNEEFWLKIIAKIEKFKLLRVLDFEGVHFGGDNLPKKIGKLMQLRYLSIRNTHIGKLPSSIVNFTYLETLDLRIAGSLCIPNVLWKLQRLRHLYLPPEYCRTEDGSQLRLDGLSNLETLVNFHSQFYDVKDLLTLNNLRKLKANIYSDIEKVDLLATAITSINPLLQQSTILVNYVNFTSEEELTVLGKLLGCHHLHKLSITGYIRNLSRHCLSLPSLTKLSLTYSGLENDPMPTLEKLPSLIHLEIGPKSFTGKDMVCSTMGFPELTHLDLSDSPNLENWRVDDGAFPKLSHLRINLCSNLKMIPDGLTYVTNLKELIVHSMPEEFKNRLRETNGKEGDDFHKVRQVPFIKLKEY